MFLMWFTFFGGSFVFLVVSPSILFLVFPLLPGVLAYFLLARFHHIFCGKLIFMLFWPFFSFSMNASTVVTYTLIVPTCTTTIITLKPYVLNVKFQHSIPRFNKKTLFCRPTQGEDSEWKEAQKQGVDKVNLRKTLLTMSTIASSSCLQQINILRVRSSL